MTIEKIKRFMRKRHRKDMFVRLTSPLELPDMVYCPYDDKMYPVQSVEALFDFVKNKHVISGIEGCVIDNYAYNKNEIEIEFLGLISFLVDTEDDIFELQVFGDYEEERGE